jgi:hypothetical protein
MTTDALTVRGKFTPWAAIARDFKCRPCFNGGQVHGVFRAYADPMTGDLDHSRRVCHGPDEHEILEEGDLIRADILAWTEGQRAVNAFEIRRNYGLLSEHDTSMLYVDEEFTGFD